VRVVSAVAALLYRLRDERAIVALVFAVVAVTSFAVAAGPRLFERVADDGLRYEAAHSTAIQRNLQFSTVDQIRADETDPLTRVVARGEAFRERLPESIGALVAEDGYVLETTRFRLAQPPKFTTYVTFRQQAGIDDLVELTAGRRPAPVEAPAGADPDAPPVFEIALSEATANTIGVVVGDRLPASVDPGDPLLRNVFPRPVTPVEIDVVGLYTLHDASDPAWFDERGIDDATIGGTADAPIAYAAALFAPAAYDDVLRLGLPIRYRWNLFVDAGRLDARRIGVLVGDLRRLETTYSTTGATRQGTTLVRTGLQGIVDRFLTARRTTEAAVTLAAIGPLAVAAGAVGLLGILVVRRRRPILRLARGRGASSGQLLLAQLWEGLLIAMPAAVIGLVVAQVVLPGPPNAVSTSGALLVGLAATLLLLLATWPVARRARRDLEREDPPVFRLAPRRLVFEVLLISLSLAAAWLLRERGLSSVQAAGTTPGFDPFLAAAPLLVGLAIGLVIIRLYPIPVRGLGWLASRRRDLVPVLGLRSIGRHPSAGYLPLLILTLTVAIGTLSSVLAASLVRDQLAASWLDVGADYRIESTSGRALGEAADPRPVEGVEAVADGLIVPDTFLSTAPGNRATMLFEALDPVAYDAVVAGSPVAQTLATTFLGWPTGADSGTVHAPIPAIVSTRMPAGAPDLGVGDGFSLSVLGRPMRFAVAARTDAFPGIRSGAAFVVAPLASVVAGWGGTPPRPSIVFVRGDDDLAATLRIGASESADTIVTSRHERYAGMRDAPLVAAVIGGFALALGVAAAYAALAVVTVAALEVQRRSREVAFLRTLGLTGRQIGLLTAVEQGAPLVLAIGIGIAVGLGLAWLVAPGLDLAAFSGVQPAAGLRVDWPSIAIVALIVAAVVVAAVAGSSWVARRLDVGYALRIGED
jgi:putative ABC transport system permease protein